MLDGGLPVEWHETSRLSQMVAVGSEQCSHLKSGQLLQGGGYWQGQAEQFNNAMV
jgi:hypothetical protein